MGVAGAGGLGASGRRPDQHYSAPAGGVVPGSRTGIVRARQVIVFGTGNGVGLFEYNGTPALGNPPVAYAAPPGVTQDPYGNLLPSTAGGFTSLGSVGGLTVTSLNGNSLAFQNQTAQPASQALVSGFGSTSGTELLLASGKGTVGAQGVVATLLDSLQSSQAAAQMVLNPGIVAVAPVTSALLEVQGPVAITKFASGDTNAYGAARIIQETSGTLPQVISSTTAVNVQGLSVTVAARKYRIRGRLSCGMGGTAGVVRVAIQGPAISTMEIAWRLSQNNTPAGATQFTALQSAIGLLTKPATTNQGASTTFDVYLEGTLTFSAAGTMTVQAAEDNTTPVSWQINANSYWEVAPE